MDICIAFWFYCNPSKQEEEEDEEILVHHKLPKVIKTIA